VKPQSAKAKGKETIKCSICSKKFTKYKSQNKKTCSKECSIKYRSINTTGNKNPNWNENIKQRPCPVCNKMFYPKHGRDKQVCCSFKCFKKIFIGRKPTRSKGGKRIDLNNIYFRSVWEANYARLLNYLDIKWKFEPKTFIFKKIKKGTKSYLPDFYLPKSDEYVEIKGWMTKKSKTQFKRMAKYYPNIKLNIIDSKKYLKLERQYSDLIPNWEYSNASQSQTNKKDSELIKIVRKRLIECGLI
jgi:hypothetical protein